MAGDAVGLMEARLSNAGFRLVAGVDEVGRGALAGPLVAAAVILGDGVRIEGLKDSKLCSPEEREDLARRIRDVALAISIARVQACRIDRVGLQRCNLQALRRALNGLDRRPDYVLIDCFRIRRLPYPALAVKKADVVSKSVAAASIVAKVHRDAAMRRYARTYRGYGFDTNVGYATPEHWDALRRLGPSLIHRRSFNGVLGWGPYGGPPDGEVRDLEPQSVAGERGQL